MAKETLIFHEREHERKDGMYYMSVRAISAIVNLNYDGWPSDELEKSYKTFIGKPVYVDHHSDDEDRARGIILDSEFIRSEDDAWVELLLEIDAQAFPLLAHELSTGGLDSVSMGSYVETVECSVCGETVTEFDSFCPHIPGMKGQTVNGELVYEICRDITFYEISLVFDPADVTAVAKNVVAHANKQAFIGTSGHGEYNKPPNTYKVDLSDYGRDDGYHEVVDAFPFSYTNEEDVDLYKDIFDFNPYARIHVDEWANMGDPDELYEVEDRRANKESKHYVVNPDVMVNILLNDSVFQLPGAVDKYFVDDLKQFVDFVRTSEKDFNLSEYAWINTILAKSLDDYTVFDLEDVEYLLQEIARFYGTIDY